ncbi:MAG: ABC transporter ATP-binding protein [Gammaproteobacteria bacterium]|nr:ABC transporter ATP-binding protein [Gammaproteobacteria bacterium]
MKALSITNLHKTYPNGFIALKGVNLEVEQGDFFALLGANGAGKSTTIGIISSLVNKTGGEVCVFGHNISTETSLAKSCIGLVPQEFNFNVFEPLEEILINQAGYYGIPRQIAKQRAEKYLKQLDLWDKRRQMARELSGGMKRRLMIARALVHEPKLLILDEPTAGVDIEIRRSMWHFLKQINNEGVTIILTTHYLEEAESLCNRIAIIDKGVTKEQTDMKSLLSSLNNETFVLDLNTNDQPIPDSVEGCEMVKIDNKTIEVNIAKTHSLNDLFQTLTRHGIDVMSMRNKTNRLEQLFLNVLDEKSQPHLTDKADT